MTRTLIAPDAEDHAPPTPVDSRAKLPDRKRKGVSRTTLPNGTVLVSYDEPPAA